MSQDTRDYLTERVRAVTALPIVQIIFFVYSLCIYVNQWLQGYMLRFFPDIFDDSIKIVSGLYTTQGFVPYTDFGIVYPPGLLMLSRIFALDAVSRFHFFAVLYLAISVCIVIYIVRRRRSWFVAGAVLILLASSYQISEDLLLEAIWFLLVTSTVWHIERGRRVSLILMALCTMAVTLLKWERSVIAVTVACLGWGVTLSRAPQMAKRFWGMILAIFAGIVIAVVVGAIYLLASGTHLADAYHFIFEVPLKILPFRKLPLPTLFPALGSIWGISYAVYTSLAVILVLSFVLMGKAFASRRYEYLLILLFPLGLIPYASGRADSIHAYPLVWTVTLTAILATLVTRRAVPLLAVCVVYLFLNNQLFILDPLQFTHASPTYPDLVEKSLKDCREAIADTTYRSIFVGRTRYTQYVYNHVMLYLINTRVKPATRYITDEPGLQSDCVDGEAIAQDLFQAPRPMLAFLETAPQQTEANLSSSLVSCGYIERYLESSQYDKVGTCTHLDHEYEIRSYR